MNSSTEAGPKSDPLDTFPGDCGEINVDTRRALVQLLLGPSIDARRQSKLWPIILRDEQLLRSRLHELFLDLVVDRDQQVAFTRQIQSTDSLEVPVLLRRANLTFLDSVLLLFLRHRLTQADAQSERAVVARDEMKEQLSVFEPIPNTDKAKFQRQSEGAVEKAKKLNLIYQLRGAEERFEISPTLKLLFPVEEIEALRRIYETLAKQDAATNASVSADAEGEEDE